MTLQRDVLVATKAASFAGLLAITVLVLVQVAQAQVWMFGVITLATIAVCSGWRVIDQWQFADVNERARNLLLVGNGASANALSSMLHKNRNLGHVIREFLDEDRAANQTILQKTLNEQFIDEVVIALPCSRAVITRVTKETKLRRIDLTIVPDLSEFPAAYIPLDFIGSVPHFSAKRQPIPEHWLLVKRVIDVAVAGLTLVLLSPLLLLISIAIRLDSRGPILYRSTRVGRRGRKFCFYKFRTMVRDADAIRKQLEPLNERQGLMFKMVRDPRVTCVGKFLRKYSLDELPQLWNVIKGDMSLVGPRPPSLDEYENYSWQHLTRLGIRPGITGLWQVTARHDPRFETAVMLDTKYIRNWSMALDCQILLRTIPAVFRGEGR
jgi:exopolysaccharide biosynthesis polyprenyl glycosylphosphotransferase